MSVHLFSRGPADQLSGGYRYNRHLMRALEAAGHRVVYHPDANGIDELGPDDLCLVDGLALAELVHRLLDSPANLVLLLHAGPQRWGSSAALLSRARVLVTGKRTLESIRAIEGGAAVDVGCIEPGVPAGWQAKSSYPASARRLLMVANYVEGKGYRRLLDALAGLADSDWRLRAFGNTALDPSYAASVRSRCEALGLSGRVRLGGGIDHGDVYREMRNADLLLVPSERESYSMATAEAIACGLPVLSHRTGAIERFRRSRRVHYLDATHPPTLREGLRSLIEEPRAYAGLTRARPSDVRDWETVGAEIVAWLGIS